jgi:hypothetical protein
MAKRSKTRRSTGLRITVPLAIVAGMAGPGIKLWEARGSASGMAREAGRIFTGFDFWSGQFVPGAMKYGTLPILMGFLVHWVIGSKLGLNRAIARSGLPLIRI